MRVTKFFSRFPGHKGVMGGSRAKIPPPPNMFHPDPSSKQSAAVSITSMTYTIAVCSVLNSWRWTENCPKHVEFYSKNKFEKLVHLVGFIIRIYHDARSSEFQNGGHCYPQACCHWRSLPFVISVKPVTSLLLASVQNLVSNCTSQFNCQ
jgi:hypothetical protein